MRIACSNCNAVYELPPARLRPGTGVRCARCKTVWVPVERVDAEPEIRPAEPEARLAAPEPAEEAALAAAPVVAAPVVAVPEAMPEVAPVAVPPREAPDAAEAPAPRPSRLPLLAWVLSVALLLGAAAAAVAYRDAVAAAWPASERAYRLLGLR